MNLQLDLEERLATFLGMEAAIVYQSGYLANLSVIPALVGKGDIVFCDELSHPTIIDACRIAQADIVFFTHVDFEDLRQVIQEKRSSSHKRALIITDGVFSMDGDIAPLPEYSDIAEENDIWLMVDDAHGLGVLGEGGRGIVNHFGMYDCIDVYVGVTSKALGVVGGVVAGRKTLIDWLRQTGRASFLSSSLTVPDVAACLAALDLLEESDELVKKLWGNTQHFSRGMASLGFDLSYSKTPIMPVMFNEVSLAQKFSQMLFEAGVFAPAIVSYPNSSSGRKARIRIINTAGHSVDDLDKAVQAFEKVGVELGLV